MGHLPIPADMYFQDFAFDVLEYSVSDGGSVVGTYRGLSNTDETGDYIGFLVKDQPQISVGSTLSTIDGLEKYQVRQIAYDRYNGQPELLKAYY